MKKISRSRRKFLFKQRRKIGLKIRRLWRYKGSEVYIRLRSEYMRLNRILHDGFEINEDQIKADQ